MPKQSLKILFACSEAYPLIKTGGLADVAFGLTRALHELGQDIKIILPAYKQILEDNDTKLVSEFSLGEHDVRLIELKMPHSGVTVWLVDIPELYYRNGGPYAASDGVDWPDNAERFSTFSKVVSEIALGNIDLNWQPNVIHCNDWQTGLVPAYLSLDENSPASIFTIHNLAYLGLFSHQKFKHLQLPEDWWAWNMMEFHNHFSFIKGGLVFADQISTVSPTYAEEIKTTEFGYGMEGLLNYRSHLLTGILNGVDYEQWNPAVDPLIPKHFDSDNLSGKQNNKRELQQLFELPQDDSAFLIGIVGRMVEQKGYDLLLQILDKVLERNIQITMLGTGDLSIESALFNCMDKHPNKFSVNIGYDEATAHLIEAGSDAFLMPSKFEPCGLNQFYSLKYGSVPIVSNIGGLSDSVTDKTGFKFESGNATDLLSAIESAFQLFNQPEKWQNLMQNGMNQDYSWKKSAKTYISLYHKSIKSQYHIPSNFSV